MRVWKVRIREKENNPLRADWEHKFVQAENFDEASNKVRDYLKTAYPSLKLEIVEIGLELEVDIE